MPVNPEPPDRAHPRDFSQSLQWSVKKIYPPIMTFVGPKELTGQLTNPEITGKSYTLTGQLYIKKRLFRLAQVQGPEEKELTEPEAEAALDSGAP